MLNIFALQARWVVPPSPSVGQMLLCGGKGAWPGAWAEGVFPGVQVGMVWLHGGEGVFSNPAVWEEGA